MHVQVNGIRLFFDVEGAELAPAGGSMRRKPTLILLHGGPGMDHSGYKPRFSELADVCQVVYLDHRGNGRSDPATPETWTLAQWGDDVHAFCETLGIERPIVYGASFGGTVAMSYATRHPRHPGKLVLVSAEAQGASHYAERIAMFEKLGGAEVGALARRRFLGGQVDPAMLQDWIRLAFPVYTRKPRDADAVKRALLRPEVNLWFTRPGGEGRGYDLLRELGRIQCPTLVMGGEEDPMTPIVCQEEIAAALPSHLVRFERFAGCGHGVVHDAPERAMAVIRQFIAT
jgi:proline iminopeptidase